MKNIKQTLLNRRSIRRYERESIPSEQMEFIYDAIRNTPTSYNGQQFSVIDVTDQAIKEKLYELTQQKQIKTCNHFLVFCADYNKIRTIAKAKDIEMPPFEHTADGVIVGIVDASLAMMSAVVAAESCGLGTCCIGYTRTAAPREISEILKLPKGVYCVCGLAIGIPRETPDLKPKQPTSLMIHQNHYRTDNLTNDLLDYDSTVTHFNANRSGTKSDNDWAAHIVDYYRIAMDYKMLQALQDSGYDITR
ncbi:MAG: nitroreductase family protein [Muribaculaceae bacterium]|nr:nitroreductase family protein [Muribaculaceae bacterium]